MSIEALEKKSNRPRFKKTLCFLFSGKAGVGKSFCSSVLNHVSMLDDLNSTVGNFAYGVKKTAKDLGWDGTKDERGRSFLQEIGALGRKYDPNIWVDKSIDRFSDHPDFPFDVVIFDDWRFPNEYERILDHHLMYKPIKIRVISSTYYDPNMTDAQKKDASETALDSYEFHYTIVNDGKTIKDLEKELFDILVEEYKDNIF